MGGDRPWMCAVKLVGRAVEPRSEPAEATGPAEAEPEPTHTLLLRMGRGATADDARRDGLAQLTLVYGSPVEPPPLAVISQKKSDPPPPPEPLEGADAGAAAGPAPADSGWLQRIARRVKR